jgi:hypothetical protein
MILDNVTAHDTRFSPPTFAETELAKKVRMNTA